MVSPMVLKGTVFGPSVLRIRDGSCLARAADDNALRSTAAVSKNGQQIHTYINNKKVRSGGHRVVSVLRGKEAGTVGALWGLRPPALWPAQGRRMP